ncbi:tRNA pseudouridine(38-40) synthase TruA [Agarivorans sp. MS3-6]|uniref:tRNA pseudouridine(38-40) synthase TruA n=1 Tax=Agarivorans sp. TSD2052 TaxID=2937286 RepID=UPI00200C23B0|nr:tRNA pseudouridine(38-40) synthase TruA [Agarivorans sp. TSD2052]UPW16977.1 tRNA pseudouridine(38-40) synthase TruA [Agarivorans sp. TSD2052]
MRIALGIEYDGADYYGWQRQLDVRSIQQELESSLSIVANCPIQVQCAGRTDAGVHATGQVVHFDSPVERKMAAWTLGVNANLPKNVAVRWAQPVGDEFHARFSATARRYRYVIYNGRFRPAILGQGLSFYHQPLDIELMEQAGKALLGEQDYTSFRALHCQSHSPRRRMEHLTVTRYNDYVVVDVKANAFLHHMVRNIVGSLIKIGQGDRPVEWIAELLALKDRSQAAATAKAGGLYLVQVDYPSEFNLPQLPIGPLFLPAS